MATTSTKTVRQRPRGLGDQATHPKAATSEGEAAGTTRPRFLVIGDCNRVDPALRSVFPEPYDLVRIESPEAALRALDTDSADVVLLDEGLISPTGQLTQRSTEDGSDTVVWMALDPNAVRMLGDLLRAVAGVPASAGQPAAKPARPAATRKQRHGTS